MKKFSICLLIILIFPLMLFGCTSSKSVSDSLSEVTKIYFSGTDSKSNIVASISVGEREEPYKLDGYNNKTCGFSLINVDFGQKIVEDDLEVKIIINENESDLILFFNPVTNSYMADLGYELNPEDKVFIIYANYQIEFENVSQFFVVDYMKALKIGESNLEEEIKKLTVNGNFNGEVYLKILTEKSSSFNKLFWAYTIIDREGNENNVVIDVDDENIIFKN